MSIGGKDDDDDIFDQSEDAERQHLDRWVLNAHFNAQVCMHIQLRAFEVGPLTIFEANLDDDAITYF